NDVALFHDPDPAQASRWRQADARSQARIAHPRIEAQQTQDIAVDIVQSGHLQIIPIYRITMQRSCNGTTINHRLVGNFAIVSLGFVTGGAVQSTAKDITT